MKRVAFSLVATALWAVSSFGAIARTQAVSADATSVSISSTSTNDALLVLAYNGVSNTAPSLPVGFTSLSTAGGSGQSYTCGYKVSAGGDISSGTWTNATQVVCLVYSGASASAPFINATGNAGASTTVGYLGFTMTHTDGTGWIAGVGGAKAATAGMNGNTAALTNRTNVTTANGLDTGAAVTSFANQTLSVTGNGRWATVTVEIVVAGGATPPPTATNGFFEW